MGRGYAANRSASARFTSKQKRVRSVSTHVHLPRLLSEGDEASEPSENEAETILDSTVLTKFKQAGKITDTVLEKVCSCCVEGETTFSLCQLGDSEIRAMCQAVFRRAHDESGKKLKRGIAFPTTVSVNHLLCHHSPLNEAEAVKLCQGDVVKVHLGVHIDGYSTFAARTVIVRVKDNADEDVVAVADSALRCVRAAAAALDCMLHMAHPGAENSAITCAIEAIGEHFAVQPVEGVLSTRTKRWVPDSLNAIITRKIVEEDPQQDVAPCTLRAGQVWNLDVAFTDAPTHKIRPSGEPCNIYRRNEIEEMVRLNAAIELSKEIKESFMCFPFSVVNTSAPLRAKLGVTALKKASMVDAFPPLACPSKYCTARFSCTVAITPTRANVLCGAVVLPDCFHWPPLPPPTTPIHDILTSSLDHAPTHASSKKRESAAGEDEVVAEEDADETHRPAGRAAKRRRTESRQ